MYNVQGFPNSGKGWRKFPKMLVLLGYNLKIVVQLTFSGGNKNLVEGGLQGGIFLGRGRMSKFLAGRGDFPPFPPVGKTLP